MTATDPEPEPAPAEDSGPVRPEQAREDTDTAWGDYPEPGDEHLYRDRPPHWADF